MLGKGCSTERFDSLNVKVARWNITASVGSLDDQSLALELVELERIASALCMTRCESTCQT